MEQGEKLPCKGVSQVPGEFELIIEKVNETGLGHPPF